VLAVESNVDHSDQPSLIQVLGDQLGDCVHEKRVVAHRSRHPGHGTAAAWQLELNLKPPEAAVLGGHHVLIR
jgi:hypothetical protein